MEENQTQPLSETQADKKDNKESDKKETTPEKKVKKELTGSRYMVSPIKKTEIPISKKGLFSAKRRKTLPTFEDQYYEKYRKPRSKIDHEEIQHHKNQTIADHYINDRKRLKRSRDWTKKWIKEKPKFHNSSHYVNARDEYLTRIRAKSNSISRAKFYRTLAKEYGQKVKEFDLETRKSQILALKKSAKNEIGGSFKKMGRFAHQYKHLQRHTEPGEQYRERLLTMGNQNFEKSKSKMTQKKKENSFDLKKENEIILQQKQSEYNQRKKDLRTKFNYLRQSKDRGVSSSTDRLSQKIKNNFKFLDEKGVNYKEKTSILAEISRLDERLDRQESKLKYGLHRKNEKKENIEMSYISSIKTKLSLLKQMN